MTWITRGNVKRHFFLPGSAKHQVQLSHSLHHPITLSVCAMHHKNISVLVTITLKFLVVLGFQMMQTHDTQIFRKGFCAVYFTVQAIASMPPISQL